MHKRLVVLTVLAQFLVATPRDVQLLKYIMQLEAIWSSIVLSALVIICDGHGGTQCAGIAQLV